MPATLTVIRDATDRVQAAETGLEELAAMVALNRIVRKATREYLARAMASYTDQEIARAIGSSRQYAHSLRRRTATPSPERNDLEQPED